MADTSSKLDYLRMRLLKPKCRCGEDMTVVNAVWLTENMEIVFLGSCGFDCPTNPFVFDIQSNIKDLKAKNISECREVSDITDKTLYGDDEDEIQNSPGAGKSN